MSFRRWLRNVCLFMFAVVLLLFALTTTTAYMQGAIPPTQYMVFIYLLFVLTLFGSYMMIYWDA